MLASVQIKLYPWTNGPAPDRQAYTRHSRRLPWY